MSDQPRLADELKKLEYEPLLPVEKKLIAWSIGLGIVLLGLLLWVSYTFFPLPSRNLLAPTMATLRILCIPNKSLACEVLQDYHSRFLG